MKNIVFKKMGLYLSVTIVLLVCWLGVLDHYAEINIDSAIKDAGILYGSARLINGLVSVVQDIDVSLVLISISPGELLDPVNDIIERFSEVLTVAIASLAFQKILLYITSNNIFNVLITISAMLVVYIHLLNQKYFNRALKVFLTLVILRVSLVFIILFNSAVDAFFLQEQTDQDVKQLKSMEHQLETLVESVDAGHNQRIINNLQLKASKLESKIKQAQDNIDKIEKELESQEAKKDTAQAGLAISERINPLYSNSEIDQIEAAIAITETKLKRARSNKKATLSEFEKANESIACEKKRAEGGSCSVGEWVEKKTDMANINEKITQIQGTLDSQIQSIINLIAMIIMKSLFFPVLFWWALYRLLKLLWCGRYFDFRNAESGM